MIRFNPKTIRTTLSHFPFKTFNIITILLNVLRLWKTTRMKNVSINSITYFTNWFSIRLGMITVVKCSTRQTLTTKNIWADVGWAASLVLQ